MPDFQEELAQILATTQHDGEIVTFLDPPQRASITTPEIVLQFMRGVKQSIGLGGAKVLMYSAGYRGKRAVARETPCQAAGSPVCRFEVTSPE